MRNNDHDEAGCVFNLMGKRVDWCTMEQSDRDIRDGLEYETRIHRGKFHR